jgi:hypothetical protein
MSGRILSPVDRDRLARSLGMSTTTPRDLFPHRHRSPAAGFLVTLVALLVHAWI